jgi:VWFA-related protein
MSAGSTERAIGVAVLSVAAALAIGVDSRAQAPAMPTSATVYVSAVDKKGAPVADLSAADFRVKSNGKSREIVRAAVATAPMQVAVLVDDIGVGSDTIKQSVAAFTTALQGKADVQVTTWQRTSTSMVGFSKDEEDSPDMVRPLYTTVGEAPHLLEGFLEASQTFIANHAARPVIVVITPATADAGNVRVDDVVDSLARSRAQLYVVNLAAPSTGALNTGSPMGGPSSDGMASTPSLPSRLSVGDAPERSGGRIDRDVSLGSLQPLMQELATELAGQYAIEYHVDHWTGEVAKLSVDVERKGVKLRAPTRVVE